MNGTPDLIFCLSKGLHGLVVSSDFIAIVDILVKLRRPSDDFQMTQVDNLISGNVDGK